jgi:DNA-binding response OmpR family regulator
MKRLVIIEDDISTLEIFKIIFSSAYHLNCFNNSKAIYNRRFEVPDLFLIDRVLPGTCGLELCRFVKSSFDLLHIPVIVISAMSHTANAALQAGADEFIEKPFSLDNLLNRVRHYIG